ncbi:hypothetical protein [Liquorilactobacillus cacaonum]|nr:hypothetical protein [Liquorilactobacillus cacaonum]
MGFEYYMPAYHVNSPETIQKILDSFTNGVGELYTTIEDGYWAGNGMYFWDNTGNADYWVRQRKHKGLSSKVMGTSLLIDEDSILDLTNENVLNSFERLWPMVAEKLGVDQECSPGKKVNSICEVFEKIKIVKLCGYYPKKKEHPFFDNSSTPQMTIKARIIFCVKDIDRLSGATNIE